MDFIFFSRRGLNGRSVRARTRAHAPVRSLGQTENQWGVRQMLPLKKRKEKPSCSPPSAGRAAPVLIYAKKKKTSRGGQSAGERLTASVNRLQVDAARADRAKETSGRAALKDLIRSSDYEPRCLRNMQGKQMEQSFPLIRRVVGDYWLLINFDSRHRS